jgi:hypothetical protein
MPVRNARIATMNPIPTEIERLIATVPDACNYLRWGKRYGAFGKDNDDPLEEIADMLASLAASLEQAEAKFDKQCELLQAYMRNDREQHDALEQRTKAIREVVDDMERNGMHGFKACKTLRAALSGSDR